MQQKRKRRSSVRAFFTSLRHISIVRGHARASPAATERNMDGQEKNEDDAQEEEVEEEMGDEPLEEQLAERQAAYLNGRRQLLPQSSGSVARLSQRGIELLWRAYELGHEAAAWDLACCVPAPEAANQEGEGGACSVDYVINWNLAVPLYKKYAKTGHPIAQKNLGTCYFRGWGVPQSIPKAMKLYRKASLQNYDVAQYNLGVCYRQEGSENDSSQALELYQKSAAQGLHAAQCALARCYLYGRGVNTDVKKGVELMHSAAESYPTAMVIMARWYEIGYYNLALDIRLAMEYAIKAVYERETDGWDIIIRLLSHHYEEDKRGPMYAIPTLASLCCDRIYEHEIIGKCLLRDKLMKQECEGEVLVPDELENQGRIVMLQELQRRKQLMSVLPLEMQDKLRTDRVICLSPQCSREYYGKGRVVRRYLMRQSTSAESSEPHKQPSIDEALAWFSSTSPTSLISQDEVILSFCSMHCARYAFNRLSDDHVPIS